MRQNSPNRLTPILMAICVIVGVVIGTFYANHFSGNRLNIINSGSNRLNNLLHIIAMYDLHQHIYVDALVQKSRKADESAA